MPWSFLSKKLIIFSFSFDRAGPEPVKDSWHCLNFQFEGFLSTMIKLSHD